MPAVGQKPTREEVVHIVSAVMREVLIANTPYTDADPNQDERGFHWGLIPKKNLWDGWRANDQAWYANLGDIVTVLRRVRPSFTIPAITQGFVRNTLDKELIETLSLLVDLIMEGFA